MVIESTSSPSAMELLVDLLGEDRGCHKFALARVHQVEMDMRIDLKLGMIGHVHVGDYLSLANLLAFLDQDERQVKTGVSGISHWFDAVVKVDGFSLLDSDRQGDSITVIGLAFVEDAIKHFALFKGFIDLGYVTIGDGIDRWITGRLAGIHTTSRRLEIDVGSRVRLGCSSALVRMAGTDVLPVDEELCTGLSSKLADVGEWLCTGSVAADQVGQ